MSSTNSATGTTKPGSLIIAGSGVSSVAHLTLETVSYLKNADQVFYLVTDPVTEAFIQENNQNVTNLVTHYAASKHRYQTYVEMAEVILKEVRAGRNVFGIFYGHPGVLAIPTHRALTLARQEGYEARMLPGISTIDYMFADLELEPGQHGCMIHEATELLARNRRLNPSVHNIILQAANVCSATLEKEPSKFQLLVEHLIRDFGPDHQVVHYSGAVLPQSASAMVVFDIENLRNEQLANQIRNTSILYIPPRDIIPLHPDTSAAIKLPDMMGLLSTSVQWIGPRFIETAGYGPIERAFVEQLEQRAAPEGQKSLRASTAMRKFMINLALDPNALKEYKANPSAVAAGALGLTDHERFALEIASEGAIFAVMLRASEEEPTKEQLTAIDESGAQTIEECPMCTGAA